ncbi:hypothetical protein EV1_038361 [Malus domestica]
MATAVLPVSEPARKQPRPDHRIPQVRPLTCDEAAQMIAALPESDRKALLPKLRVKSVPTASGIAVVAGMWKPHRWPHIATTGNICVYCPGGPDSDFERSTQSYTGYEPTSNSGKVEFILMGGTFMWLPVDYRDYFIRNLHDALSGHTSANAEEAFAYSEHAYHLVPSSSGRSRRLTKVVAHMMPDLPNVGVERDMESFREFFESPLFRADGLKIYPTLVIRGTGLYELWKTGRYRNYPPEQLVDIVARILAMVPPWTRVYRVQQDIPMPLVTSGVEKGNLRELAFAWMEDLGLKCRERLEFRTYITKLGQTKWSLFVVIIWQMKDGKHFFHMKILARYTPGEFPVC